MDPVRIRYRGYRLTALATARIRCDAKPCRSRKHIDLQVQSYRSRCTQNAYYTQKGRVESEVHRRSGGGRWLHPRPSCHRCTRDFGKRPHCIFPMIGRGPEECILAMPELTSMRLADKPSSTPDPVRQDIRLSVYGSSLTSDHSPVRHEQAFSKNGSHRARSAPLAKLGATTRGARL